MLHANDLTQSCRARNIPSAARKPVKSLPFFGENLKRHRIAAGLTQAELAEKSGLSLANIQNWERNHRDPRTDALFTLARTLGVSAEAFLEKPKKKLKPKRGRPAK